MPATSSGLKPPDVLVLGAEWRERALLRAQLIEEGYQVIAVDAWPIPTQYQRPDMRPRVMIVDLHGLPEPRDVLDELASVIEPDHVLVVTGLGTLPDEDVRRLGYRVVPRPARIGDIVRSVAALLA
jgi:hypothetical protein